nr:geranylgeranyl pyrophosphate synthase-like [Danaus plexippus plexippus]
MSDYEKNGQEDLEKELLAPFTHLLQVSGKRFRNKIVLAFNHWLKVPEDQGGYIYVNHLHDAIVGQGFDIYCRDNLMCPTEAEYKKMVERKTGGMLLLGVKLIQLFSENKQNYDDFVRLLGYYFQLRDDYCNLRQQEALEEGPGGEDIHASKENIFCEDITEGKFSLPIIHAMTTTEGPTILRILRQRTRNMELKKYCLSLMEISGSLQYTRDLLSELDRKARKELIRLGGNPMLEDVLDSLLSWKDVEAS